MTDQYNYELECVYLGREKYEFLHDVFDYYCEKCQEWMIRKHCRLFYHLRKHHDTMIIIKLNFHKDLKLILLKKVFCEDISNYIISFL